MAQNKQVRRHDEIEVSEDDPLAELTRIMGLDAGGRQPAQTQPQHVASDQPAGEPEVGIDLEQELLGELGDMSEPAQAAPVAPEPRMPEPAPRMPEPVPAIPEPAVPSARHAAPVVPEIVPEPVMPEPAPAAPEPVALQREAELAPRAPVMRSEEPESFERLAARPRTTPHLPLGRPEPLAPQPQAHAAPPVAPSVRPSLQDELKALLEGIDSPAAPAPAARPAATVAPQPRPAAPEPKPAAPEPRAAAPEPRPVASEPRPVAPEPRPVAPEPRAFAPEPERREPETPKGDVAGFDMARSFDTELENAVAAAAAESSMPPEIETVEVPEKAQTLADDLEIPEVEQEPPAPRLRHDDDLEAEFSSIFGEQHDEEERRAAPIRPAAPAVEAAASSDAEDLDVDFDIGPLQLDLDDEDDDADEDKDADRIAAATAAIASSAATPVMPRAVTRPLEPAFDPAMEEAGLAPPTAGEPRDNGRRGMMIAAVIAGVAIVGGIGAFVMSFGGGESDAPPAVVKAEPGDVKVKPKDPGGTTVPNQDNKVYEKVAGETTDDTPSQERLVTTAEEPVDVTTRTVKTRVIRTVSAEGGKSEDRILPSEPTEPSLSNDDVAVVVPRRVRTMIVKPDGTLVPREEVEPALAPEVTGTATSASASTEGSTETAMVEGGDGETVALPTLRPDRMETSSAGASQEAVSEPEAAEPVARLIEPEPAKPEPARPAASEAARPAAAEKPAPKQEQAVARTTPPETQTASGPAGRYSVQIASQPTREGAQESYASLARRYGEVIGGRGVNIVRAEIPGKGVYYRVRIPVGSKAEAADLCQRYKSAGGSCFVAR